MQNCPSIDEEVLSLNPLLYDVSFVLVLRSASRGRLLVERRCSRNLLQKEQIKKDKICKQVEVLQQEKVIKGRISASI